jgi:hypothetical protein
MASIVRELELAVSVEAAWSAVRDVGAVHTRLVPGLVRDVRLENGMRHVAFSNGLEIDELIVSVDETEHRVVYAVQNRARHHQASMQVIGEGGRCRLVWITDLLPDDAAGRFAAMIDAALPIIKKTLETSRDSGRK